jgi:glutathione S-transferase
MIRCNQYMQFFDKMLTHTSFLAGDNLTLADITVGTMLFRYFELENLIVSMSWLILKI